MSAYSLYTPKIWEGFLNKHLGDDNAFKLKTYPQFDPFFDFKKKNFQIQDLVSDPTLEKVAKFSFTPFVKILIKTPRFRYQEDLEEYDLDTKIRPISFASHFDTYLYSFYAYALTERYQQYIHETGFDKCVLAYRTDLEGKCNIQFAKEVFENIRERTSKGTPCTAIALDITGYFDNIDHSLLREKWCKILGLSELPIDQYKVFRSLTKYSYANKNNLLKHFDVDLIQMRKKGEKWFTLLDLIPDTLAGSSFVDKMNLLRKKRLIVTNMPKKDKLGQIANRGIPQGSPMSALLSNIYLIDFDYWLHQLSEKYDFIYRRYCDDLLIVCGSENAEEINNLVINEIKNYSLTIQEKKTDFIEFTNDSKGKIRGFNKKDILKNHITIDPKNEIRYYKNLQYLGFEYNGQNIYIRPSSLSRFFRKMKGRIVKTIMMAYSDNSKLEKILKKRIHGLYSHVGSRNFITYALNASRDKYSNAKREIKEGMNSKSIKRQLSRHFQVLEKEIRKTSLQRFLQKEASRIQKLKEGKKTKTVILKS